MDVGGTEIPAQDTRDHRTQGLVFSRGRTGENERKGKKSAFVQLSFSAEESWSWAQWSVPLTGVGASPYFSCQATTRAPSNCPQQLFHANWTPTASGYRHDWGKEGPGKAEITGTRGLIPCLAASPMHH